MNSPRTVRHRFPKRPISAIILSSNVTVTSRHFHCSNHAIITYETEDAAPNACQVQRTEKKTRREKKEVSKKGAKGSRMRFWWENLKKERVSRAHFRGGQWARPRSALCFYFRGQPVGITAGLSQWSLSHDLGELGKSWQEKNVTRTVKPKPFLASQFWNGNVWEDAV